MQGSYRNAWLTPQRIGMVVASLLIALACAWLVYKSTITAAGGVPRGSLVFEPRLNVDDSGYATVNPYIVPWERNATSEQIRDRFEDLGFRAVEQIDRHLNDDATSTKQRIALLSSKAALLNSEGEAKSAYQVLEQVRNELATEADLARRGLYTIIFLQGVTALRRGENENCILCRGESSCILPITSAAVHLHPEGSRLAIHHFTEYLEQFPDDLEARWLLNLAHMTLGEHPAKVDPKYLVSLEHWKQNEFDIGKFRDIGHLVGVNSFNQAGGAIMDDMNNDGLLDVVTTTLDPTGSMNFYQNNGQGGFENRTQAAGISKQFGGLNCVQTDYNNDGYLDIFIIRGAWLTIPMRPSLLRNNKNGTFTDVTEEAGLLYPANSIAASWADFDNDGWLDLYVCCERQPSGLYRNLGNNTFEDVTRTAGVFIEANHCKGIAWVDIDNDGFQDLFLNFVSANSKSKLFRNNRDGTFQEVTESMGIDGPVEGFSCWAWDYDNDGWLDIFATSYRRTLGDIVKGIQGVPHDQPFGRLFRNRQGKGFEDVSKAAGLDSVYATMGSNFGDFDNDGFLDMYLGTGDPSFSTLVPNRMFKNVAGRRFSEITASAGTGHLQKGHGVACGDWDRDGNIDIFIEMGGAVDGDKYHNVLFQNPGHEAHFLTLKLIGKKSNRAAIGARIKVVTAGANPQTIHRHISTGSSFGANPLQQTIGLAQADRIALLEIRWPTSGTTQIFRDVSVDQAIEITEFDTEFRKLNWKPIPIPK
ncbi:MAG: repeat protein [Planctomycetaceae bacterium]|nr:repeat protein [Planctomycetaceae bacterium]